jgi:acetate kinase
MDMIILTLNCRRFSVQYQVFHWYRQILLARGTVERVVVGDSYLTHNVPGRPQQIIETDCEDHVGALHLILSTLVDPKIGVIGQLDAISAVGHRVAHGGEKFTASVLIDDEVTAAIEELAKLAPLHMAANVAGIRCAQRFLPDIPHVAIFDTAFHQTMPEPAYIYPLPYDWYQKYGIRRYGFHGQSHQHAARRGAALAGVPLENSNVVTVHVGEGVSLCAVKNGISVDTSMGLTQLEGVMMGHSCGNIDPGIIPFMMTQAGLSASEIELILYQKSGVTGIAGPHTSRRSLVDEARDGDQRCRLALKMESYRLRKYLGAYLAVTGKVDAIVFTYGEGWRDWPIRGLALREMEQFGIVVDPEKDWQATVTGNETEISRAESRIRVYVTPSGEDKVLNEDVAAILKWEHKEQTDAV